MVDLNKPSVLIDNGGDTIDASGQQPDERSQMLSSAARIAANVISMEGTLAETAKQWGHHLFRAVRIDGANMDTLINDSKVAANWPTLGSSDAGRKAKQRLEVYFSNARLVAERWEGMTDEQRADVLAGTSSIHYLAGQFRKADSDAKKAADKEAKRLKAEQEAADAKANAANSESETRTGETGDEPRSLIDLANELSARIAAASDDELNDAFDSIAAVADALNARIDAASETVVPEEVAKAA